MSGDLSFACQCSAVRGVVRDASPDQGNRVVCYCKDCQALARLCAAEDRVLNAHGGTDLYQSRCARMELHAGADKLACVHLTEEATLRWHTTCCRTPMFNSYSNGRVPYVTTLLGNCDHEQCGTLLGAPLGHLFVEEASSAPGDVPRMTMFNLMRRFLGRMVKDLLSGDHRRSALFDAKTLAPISPPTRLTANERAALDPEPIL